MPSCPDTVVLPEQTKESPSKKQKSGWIWWVLALILLLGGVGIYFFLNKEEQDIAQVQTSGIHEGHQWVDLGLPSGLRWATCNVGAASPEESGEYFAWGETSSKLKYTVSNSANSDTYLDDISGYDWYDVARYQWGGDWRMPTKAEFQELIDECTWEWTVQAGINGYKLTSKKNGNSIFLPAVGIRDGKELCDYGKFGNYWSSTPNESKKERAYSLFLSKEDNVINKNYRKYGGLTIRPVLDECLTAEEELLSEEYVEVPAEAPAEEEYFDADVNFEAWGGTGILYAWGEEYTMAYVSGGWSVNDTYIDGFYMGCCEVTQALWEAVMGTDVYQQRAKANPSWSLRGVGGNLPMYYVNYHDAQEFCTKLNDYTGLNFYLPSEDEWEYAARGGEYKDSYKYSGSHNVHDVAWYSGNSNDLTHEVGSKLPNILGLYDMSGNVREWCASWEGSKRALRGGGWYNDAEAASVTSRYFESPEVRDNNYGFRLCLKI